MIRVVFLIVAVCLCSERVGRRVRMMRVGSRRINHDHAIICDRHQFIAILLSRPTAPHSRIANKETDNLVRRKTKRLRRVFLFLQTLVFFSSQRLDNVVKILLFLQCAKLEIALLLFAIHKDLELVGALLRTLVLLALVLLGHCRHIADKRLPRLMEWLRIAVAFGVADAYAAVVQHLEEFSGRAETHQRFILCDQETTNHLVIADERSVACNASRHRCIK
mmetsp:Transcript_15813/g.24320  ORF Transcript_15813/g.24320 Transcript_15813/m.24320 type:complete len:221 (-) Transcript_15813:76-738(-)